MPAASGSPAVSSESLTLLAESLPERLFEKYGENLKFPDGRLPSDSFTESRQV
jgi:hypothetical protein